MPLRPPHEDVSLDLQRTLNETYDRAHYADSIYTRPVPSPPLNPDDAAWVRQTLHMWLAAHRAG